MINTKKNLLVIIFIFLSQVAISQVCDVLINVCSNDLISSNPTDEYNFPNLQGTCVDIDGVRSVWYKIKIESNTTNF